MKTPVSEVISIDAAKCTGLFRYDIGHNVDACNIPVFCTGEGATYPMFGEIFGSICMKINVANENVQSVTLKCYPQMINFWKSNKIAMTISKTNKNMKNTIQRIDAIINDNAECGRMKKPRTKERVD